MGGDGMGGMAAAIGIVMLFMLLAGFGISFWIGALFARANGWQGGQARRTAIIAGLGGLGIGFAVVTATFFESSWSPPPRLDIAVQPGFKEDWAILIEDPDAATELDWRGTGLPFTQRNARVALPANGLLRVRSFGEGAGRSDLDVRWSDGAVYNGYAGGPAPPGIIGTSYMAVARAGPDGMPLDLPQGEALSAEIRRRQGR